MDLIDIHCHGGGDATFGTDAQSAHRVIEAHASRGTTALVASLVSAPVSVLADQMAVLRSVAREDPRLLGVHLEGPWLAPTRAGAHTPSVLALPSRDDAARLMDVAEGTLRIVTMAPELPGALPVIEWLAEQGVIVAVGHTEATAAQARDAFAAGARLLTHAFNAMPPIGGRDPGPVGAALADGNVYIELIADGHHVAHENLAMLATLAPERVVLVSDAMAGAAGTPGSHRLGDIAVTVSGDRAVIEGTDTLAGSTLTLSRAVDVAVSAGVPRDVARRAASSTPAALLGTAAP